MSVKHALICVAGSAPSALDFQPDFVVAADSGMAVARSLGLEVNALVGDLDSVTASDLDEAERLGITILRFPPEKDQTDLELALDYVAEFEPQQITVVGIDEGRPDHVFANVGLLANEKFARFDINGLSASGRYLPVRRKCTFDYPPGTTVSLFAIGGTAEGITTKGFHYELDDGTLEPFSSLGVSNIVAKTPAQIAVGSGTVLAIVPVIRD